MNSALPENSTGLVATAKAHGSDGNTRLIEVKGLGAATARKIYPVQILIMLL